MSRAEFEEQATKRSMARTRTVAVLGLLVVLALVALFSLGYIPHTRREQTLLAASRETEQGRPPVSVVVVKAAAGANEIVLPGNMQAFTETSVYSRADGYLRRRLVDIGDRVREGQLMAELDTPEIDQQIRQAKAAVAQMKAALAQTRSSVVEAEANRRLAEVTLKRWSALVKEGVLAPQSGDEKQSDFDAKVAAVGVAEANVGVAQANIQSAEANLKRLDDLKEFARVTAPFTGIVTQRHVDVGALITSGSSTSNHILFNLAQIDTLRIFVNVPQSNAAAIKVGNQAAVTAQEFPKRTFPGRVTRTASSLDEKSRTLLTEVQVANGDGKLLPGMYGQVRFRLPRTVPAVLAPSDALVLRNDGNYVAAVRQGKIHYSHVILGRDYGTELEVLSGLQAGDQVIRTPGDDLREGEAVEAMVQSQAK